MKKIILTILMFFIAFSELSSATEVNSLLETIKLSGFLRTRGWYLSSKITVPDKFSKTDSYKQVYYQDLFFRNRLTFQVMPELKIKSVFDISSYFGKSDFALGSGGTNIITRDVYAEFRPNSNSKFSIGLKPFSQPGGYIIARDATGLQYDQNFIDKKIKSYLKFIVAFDDANDNLGKSSDPPEYSRDYILIIGAKVNVLPSLTSELYYTGEIDRFTSEDDNRRSYLSWIGLHNKYNLDDMFIKVGGILNFGIIDIQDSADKSKFIRSNILSGLWEFEAGYNIGSDLSVSVVSEGATGDPGNHEADNSFQDIKASHGFSFIAVDNSGGLALRGSGESSWYGLAGHGVKVTYTLFDSINVGIKLLDFRTMKSLSWDGKDSTWFGNELNIKTVYKYKDRLSVFATAAVFLPGTAYKGLQSIQHDPGSVILEIMLGTKVTY